MNWTILNLYYNSQYRAERTALKRTKCNQTKQIENKRKAHKAWANMTAERSLTESNWTEANRNEMNHTLTLAVSRGFQMSLVKILWASGGILFVLNLWDSILFPFHKLLTRSVCGVRVPVTSLLPSLQLTLLCVTPPHLTLLCQNTSSRLPRWAAFLPYITSPPHTLQHLTSPYFTSCI